MKIRTAIGVNEAAGKLLSGIKSNARLAYRLGRIRDKLEKPLKSYQEARSSAIKAYGVQQVEFICKEEIEGLMPTSLPSNDSSVYVYSCSIEHYHNLSKNFELTEKNRDMYKFDNESQNKLMEELESLLDEVVEMPIRIELSLLEGVECDGFGQAIAQLDEVIVE